MKIKLFLFLFCLLIYPNISFSWEYKGGVEQDIDNSISTHNTDTSAHSAVHSVEWDAGGLSPDGTQCLTPTEVQINSGPDRFTIICADNDASTIYGNAKLTNWNAGTVTFGLKYIQTAADTGVLNSDIACACRGAGETVNNTWGTEVAIDDAAVTGSNGEDYTISAAATCNGTCAEGDTVYFRWQMDATGTTTAVATLNILGVVMNYTGTVGN